jgi:signal transduction histidine kinase
VIGAVGAFWDLSKEQRMELAYERFLETVAHQLRSPLSAVLSSLELYERRNLSQAHRAELWEIAKTEGERLRKFADQFLEHQAAAKSSLPLLMEPISVGVIARRLVQIFRAEKGKRHIQIVAAKPEPLVQGDRNRVENVLRNLVDNAMSYSPDHSPIVITIEPKGFDRVCIGVQDQGPGIPLDEHDKVFVAFYRARQASARHRYGHGLGLAIAKEMVIEMGGEIWVESEPGHGATFLFTLRRVE